jgi:hypothetical protein
MVPALKTARRDVAGHHRMCGVVNACTPAFSHFAGRSKKKNFSQLKNSSVIDITETAGGALSID